MVNGMIKIPSNLNILLTKEVIRQYLYDFIKHIIIPSPLNQAFIFVLKFEIIEVREDNRLSIKSLSRKQYLVNKEELKNLDLIYITEDVNTILEIIHDNIIKIQTHYKNDLIQSIWFDYKQTKLTNTDIAEINYEILRHSIKEPFSNRELYLPITTDLSKWDKGITFTRNKKSAFYIRDGFHYDIYSGKGYNLTTVKHINNMAEIYLKFKDMWNTSHPLEDREGDSENRAYNTFERVIYYFDKDGKQRISKRFNYIDGKLSFQIYRENANMIPSIGKEGRKTINKSTNKSIAQIPKDREATGVIDIKNRMSKSLLSQELNKMITPSLFIDKKGDDKGFHSSAILSHNNTELIHSELPLANINTNKARALTCHLNNKILTFDLETRTVNTKIQVISACLWDGETNYSFYLTDYNMSPNLLINDLLMTILQPKYKGYSIFAHNLSGFDGIFLLKSIAQLKLINEGKDYDLDIIYRDGKFITITITKLTTTTNRKGEIKVNRANYYFYDSLLTLPFSLNELSKSFGLPNKLDFDTKENDTADLENDYNFRTRLLTYNLQDCKLLYQILVMFRKDIKDLFQIDINKLPTLTSIAFKIYRTKFIKNHKIPITSLEMYNNISSAYYGGAVDVYKPYSQQAYYYDVNSLYPFVMKDNPYPVGNQYKFIGDYPIKDLFGIAYCEIKAPDNLNVPFLLHKTKDDHTIAPLGEWKGWYCSEEIKLAIEYGYKIKTIKGYHWQEKEYIFKGYVDKIYNLRMSFNKTDPKNLICKLLLNSLYGRFGMSPIMEEYKFVVTKDMEQNEWDKLTFQAEHIELGDVDLIGKTMSMNKNISKNDGGTYNKLLISTPVAIFTTAYARIYMAKLKIKYQDELLYTDTDSLFLTKELPEQYIGKELGKFKLEHDIKEAVFIAPKTYGLIVNDTNSEPIVKVKGLKSELPYDELKSLLSQDIKSIQLHQVKFYKNLSDADIQVLNTLYTLKITDNKRKIIFKDNLFIDTEPYVINEN